MFYGEEKLSTHMDIIDNDDLQPSDSDGFKKMGTFVGTRDYITPEMIEINLSGPFTDLWALGIIIYKLYSNTLPWQGKNTLQVYQEITNGTQIFPDSIP